MLPPETILPPLMAIQEKLTPREVEEPFRVTVGLVQVRVRSDPAFAVGVIPKVTQTVSEEVQVRDVGFAVVKM